MKRSGTVLGTLLITCTSVWAATDDARTVVEEFHGELLQVIEAAQTPDPGAHHARIMLAVTRSHDFEALARFSLGAAWDELDQEGLARYVAAFTEDSVAYYAAHLADYGGQFDIGAEEQNESGGVSVTATPASPDESPILYALGRVDSSWRITTIAKGGDDLFAGLHVVARRLESPRSVVQRL